MKYNLPRKNAWLMIGAFVVIIIGFALMAGEPSGATEYNPDIFSFRRITVGPMVALAGFVLMAVAIVYKGKDEEKDLGE